MLPASASAAVAASRMEFLAQIVYPSSPLAPFLEFEKEAGVLVPGEQPVQQSIRELERTCGAEKAQLEQATVLRDSPDVLDPLGRGRGDPEQVTAPRAVLLLLLDYRLDRLGRLQRCTCGLEGLGRDAALWDKLCEGPVAYDLTARGEEPADRDSVCIREIQRRPREGGMSAGENRAQ